MRVGYAKMGRSMRFDPKSQGFQGNAAVGNLIKRLAVRNPDVEFVLIGKNDGVTEGFPPNITNFWAGKKVAGWAQPKGEPAVKNPDPEDHEGAVARLGGELDAMIIHLGQHGTSHDGIPQVPFTWAEAERNPEKGMTHPFVWARNYGDSIIKGMNALGDRTDGKAPIIYLCEDPRNFHKARDVKWPTGTDAILAQYQFEKRALHERYKDARRPRELGFVAETQRGGELWKVTHKYVFGGLELMILPDDWATWGERDFSARVDAGICTTSVGKYADMHERRSWLTNEYLLKNFPEAPVYGKWDDISLSDVPPDTVVQNDPRDFADLLGSFKITLSLVAVVHGMKSGTGWTVAKPFQCWAARTVCFQVGRTDDLGWVLPTRRKTPGAELVGEVFGTKLYSVRSDWTPEELFLARWTRVETAEEFGKAGRMVADSEELWTRLVTAQRDLLQRRWDEALTETMIEERLGLRG